MIHNFNKKVPGNPFLVKNSDHIKGQFYEINLKK